MSIDRKLNEMERKIEDLQDYQNGILQDHSEMAKIIVKLAKRLQVVEKRLNVELNNKNKLNFNRNNFSWKNLEELNNKNKFSKENLNSQNINSKNNSQNNKK
jgi:hypothetical protein